MEIIYVMLVVSLLIALFFLASFMWAVRNNQFEDDYSPSVRILFEDDCSTNDATENKSKETTNDNNCKTQPIKKENDGTRDV